jgi:hypothetical protein
MKESPEVAKTTIAICESTTLIEERRNEDILEESRRWRRRSVLESKHMWVSDQIRVLLKTKRKTEILEEPASGGRGLIEGFWNARLHEERKKRIYYDGVRMILIFVEDLDRLFLKILIHCRSFCWSWSICLLSILKEETVIRVLWLQRVSGAFFVICEEIFEIRDLQEQSKSQWNEEVDQWASGVSKHQWTKLITGLQEQVRILQDLPQKSKNWWRRRRIFTGPYPPPPPLSVPVPLFSPEFLSTN